MALDEVAAEPVAQAEGALQVDVPAAGEPARKVSAMPSGSSTAWRAYSANGIPAAFARVSPSSSKPEFE